MKKSKKQREREESDYRGVEKENESIKEEREKTRGLMEKTEKTG